MSDTTATEAIMGVVIEIDGDVFLNGGFQLLPEISKQIPLPGSHTYYLSNGS